jgi:hypothetical protein
MLEMILQSIASATISAGIVAYLAKSLLSLWINKNLESHKSNLEKELERFRKNLEDKSLEHEVKFTKLHEMRAQILGETYSKLRRLLWSFNAWLETDGYSITTMADRRDRVMNAYNELFEYFHINSIWLDKSVESRLDRFMGAVSEIFKTLASDIDETGFPRSKKAWKKLKENFREELPEVLNDIEGSFRENLGVRSLNQMLKVDAPSRGAL